jgi:methyl-accepting chemotaxis protein
MFPFGALGGAIETEIASRRSEDARLLRDSLALIAPVADELIENFYDRLFAEYPHMRLMFPAVMDVQRERSLKAVIALVTYYDTPDALLPALSVIGRHYARYGASMEHYAAIGQMLLATLAAFVGDAWTPELAGAWERAYSFAAGAMMRADTGEGGGHITTSMWWPAIFVRR